MLLLFQVPKKNVGNHLPGKEASPNAHTPNKQRPRISGRFTYCQLECIKNWRFSLPKNNSKRYTFFSYVRAKIDIFAN